MMSCPR
jgi:cardiolipin synthetase 2 (EC 2.7.8.-)